MKGSAVGNSAQAVRISQVTPPPSFCYLEDSLCRCTWPVTRQNLSFLRSISVGSVINMAGEPLDLAIESFLDDNGIPHRTVAVEWKGITELEESVKCLLELIFSQANCSLLLLIGR